LIGGMALAFGINSSILPIAILGAGLVGLVQITLSVWSLVARWDEQHQYAVESTKSNTELYNRFRNIPSAPAASIWGLYAQAAADYQARELTDLTQNTTDGEKRFANRKSLYYYQNPCNVCRIKPLTMQASQCDSCGNF